MAHGEVTGQGRLGPARFPWLVAGTLGLVLLTVLFGVATKATGGGLSCHARWPVCDGGFLNLFPRSFPSWFEWLHRLVAGVTGIAILGTALVAWRDSVDPWARRAVGVGLVLLPLQVLLGRQTVLTFTRPVLALHFWTAFAIFASFAVATAIAWRDWLVPARLQYLLAAAAVLVPLQVLLNPPFVTRWTPPVQSFRYLVTFAAFALLVGAVVAGRDALDERASRVLVALVVVHPLVVYVGRHLFTPGAGPLVGYLGLSTVLVVGLLAVAMRFRTLAG